MHERQIAVLRGGPSSDYKASLQSGAAILSTLALDRIHALDILIDRDGIWHLHGIPIEPDRALRHADVVVNALHGSYGGDGTVQKILDTFGSSYTGSGSLASALTSRYSLMKQALAAGGVKTPYFSSIVSEDVEASARHLFMTFPQPSIIHSSSGLPPFKAHTIPSLIEGIFQASEEGAHVLIEEAIDGRQVLCGVIEHHRGEELYTLIPGELNAKEAYRPGNFSHEESRMIQEAARKAHLALGLRHYSLVTCILHRRRGAYVSSVTPFPALGDEMYFPEALKAVGVDLRQFLRHITDLAIAGI